jgi:hypothetical protein
LPPLTAFGFFVRGGLGTAATDWTLEAFPPAMRARSVSIAARRDSMTDKRRPTSSTSLRVGKLSAVK